MDESDCLHCVKPVYEKNLVADLTLTWIDGYKTCKYTIPTTHV